MKVHIFNWGRSSYKMEHILQGLAHLLAGWQSDEELKRLDTGVATMKPARGRGHGPLTFVLF